MEDKSSLRAKGTGLGLIDLVGGQLARAFAGVTSLKPLGAAGKVRPIAVTSTRRPSGSRRW